MSGMCNVYIVRKIYALLVGDIRLLHLLRDRKGGCRGEGVEEGSEGER